MMMNFFKHPGKRKIVLASLSVLLVAVLLVTVTKKYGFNRCRGVDISIVTNGRDIFITNDEVMKHLAATGDSLIGSRLSAISTSDIETRIRLLPYVQDVQAWLGIDGVVKIEITQRTPIARVKNAVNEQFYISSDGKLMPLVNDKPARVVFVNGMISDIFWPSASFDPDTTGKSELISRSCLYQIFLISRYISNSEFLRAQIDQIYVNANREIEMIPKVGRHLIIFGDARDMELKFRKLQIFYEKSAFLEGWQKYDTINLKYSNQVICS